MAVRQQTFSYLRKKVEILSPLPDNAISKLVDSAEHVKVEAGSVVVAEGTEAEGMYMIRSGQVLRLVCSVDWCVVGTWHTVAPCHGCLIV